MPDIMAIVSKGVFEKDAKRGGRLLGVGETLAVDRYNSSNKGLDPLQQGGRLFLVTVRPPDEKLWLVGVLDGPAFRGGAWIAPSPNQTPITDVTHLRPVLQFESGKGLSQDKGALGMSLQTPRALSAQDVAQLLAAIAAAGAPAMNAAPAPAAAAPARPNVSPAALELLDALARAPDDEGLRERTARQLLGEGAWEEAREVLAKYAHLNAHDATSLPCLCKKCLAPAMAEVAQGGVHFVRDFVIKNRRALYFWAPKELFAEAGALRSSVRASLGARTAVLDKKRRQERPAF